MRREACEQKQPGRGDTRCDRRRGGLREASFVPCRAEFGRRDLSWDSTPTFSSAPGRGQKVSGFCPTPSHLGVQEFQANARQANPETRVSHHARIREYPTVRFAGAPAIPTKNAACRWDGLREALEKSPQTRLSNQGARRGPIVRSRDALAVIFPSRSASAPSRRINSRSDFPKMDARDLGSCTRLTEWFLPRPGAISPTRH
jgi:hypothetical protein